ncbi:MAG: PRC-barrel domain-containing protein [Chromatiaceae bacterium]
MRSVRELTGYGVVAKDGDTGRIADFIVDDQSWALRYLVVDTSWLPLSRKVLIATDWIEEVDWVDQKIRVDVTSAQVEGASELDPRAPVNEEQETVLYDYYGRPRGRAGPQR